MKIQVLSSCLVLASCPALAQSTVEFSKKPEAPRPESKLYGKGFDNQIVTVTGYVEDVPKFYSGAGGKYQSWTFKLNADVTKNYANEYVLVTYHIVKWGKTVGTFAYKKGDQVTLTGRYHQFKGDRGKGGILGSLTVNDLSYNEVMN